MRTELADTARRLAAVLWRQHSVYRDRAGGMVIRGDHVQRWISLAPTGSSGEVLIRAGRILDGGTTAPARSEAVVPITGGTEALAAVCRRLLAETATAEEPPPSRPAPVRRPVKTSRTRRSSWVIIATVTGIVALVLLVSYRARSGV